MSLSRILNDGPPSPPIRHQNAASSTTSQFPNANGPEGREYRQNGHYNEHYTQDTHRFDAQSLPPRDRDRSVDYRHHQHRSPPEQQRGQQYARGSDSDLEDYAEIWEPALNEYILWTQGRKQYFDRYFQDQVVVRDARCAQENMSRYGTILGKLKRNKAATQAQQHLAHQQARAERRQHHRDAPADSRKRPLADADRLAASDLEAGPTKRRKLDEDEDDTYEDDLLSKAVRRAKQQTDDASSTRENTPRKRNGKHVASEEINSGSLPASPLGALIYGLDDDIPPLPKDAFTDGDDASRRVNRVEDSQRRVWLQIARREIPKAHKVYTQGLAAKMQQNKRLAGLAASAIRRPAARNPKLEKDRAGRAKRMMREMMLFWKKNDKDEREGRRVAEREQLMQMRQDEERREAARQARKLEFLISQTEIYSHFIGNKLRTDDAEDGGADAPQGAKANKALPAALSLLGPELEKAMEDGEAPLVDIDYDNADQTNLHKHAAQNAQRALLKTREQARAFDRQSALDRKASQALALARGKRRGGDDDDDEGEDDEPMDDGEGGTSSKPLVDLDSEELNFQNPTLMGDHLTISQPKMLMTELKEYQLKGLNWLANLYDQGINGILADEMGLGKTVQSISLLAYLAEAHNIWGPFLVIAPASTLHNWQQELARFVPNLRALPYWGTVKDRTTLRKIWLKKDLTYDRDSPFHVIVSSYPIVVQDAQYFQRIKWQYMVLDEAQAIKNSQSGRWKTTLGFHCRNRLLLTGTPIQNSMHELWALLHFIMPSLFDSHEEFNDWFAKDADPNDKSGSHGLNEHQVRRLHMILKPFMLRRVKKHVQNELGEKIEIDVMCNLTMRQRNLYREVRANLRVTDLNKQGGSADSAALQNLVMQFRKVCNHPELFQRAEVKSSLSVAQWARSGNLAREGDFLMCPYSTRNPIEYVVPKLLYEDGGLFDVPHETGRREFEERWFHNMMSIWSGDNIHRSRHSSGASAFSFLPFTEHSVSETRDIFKSTFLKRMLLQASSEAWHRENVPFDCEIELAASSTRRFPPIATTPVNMCLDVADGLPALCDIASTAWQTTPLSRPALRWYASPAVAPPISAICSNKTFVERQSLLLDSPLETLAFYGPPSYLQEDPASVAHYQSRFPGVPPVGLFAASPANQLPWSSTQVPEAKRLIYDSAKLMKLDSLLHDLKLGGHKVLIYFQMTKMIDLMEEYLVFRQYKYLRLDGSSKLEDRRDMVTDWQTRPDIFIFLLSTRAGGLGINLTAADTVVFYDSDWNPSNDAQAMDRAHRLGQTRQVTVYRLITKGTIDERIIQLARVKKDVQDVVVGNKQLHETKNTEVAQMLLKDELANPPDDLQDGDKLEGATRMLNGREIWDDGDDFFGATTLNNTVTEVPEDAPRPTSGPGSRGGRGRGRGRGTGRARGRPRGSGKKRGAAV